jgi:20S proteasome subunit beta 7
MASGGSTIGIRYDGGVLIASDTLLSFGKMAKFTNIQRLKIVGSRTCVGFTGDYADFQDATKSLDESVHEDLIRDEGYTKGPKEIFTYLQRIVYHKRCKYDPYLCRFVVMGINPDGEPFLGSMDSIGTSWQDKCVATGYGEHIVLPMIRTAIDRRDGNLTRDEAFQVARDSLTTLFYRDCSALNRIQFAEANTADGKIVVHEPVVLDTNFGHAGFAFERTKQ